MLKVSREFKVQLVLKGSKESRALQDLKVSRVFKVL